MEPQQIRPLGFIARLAALMAKPRVILTRFHDVFAPHSRYRGPVTKAKRRARDKHASPGNPEILTNHDR